jgi:uncharacterized protein (DUF58 family)
VPETAATPRMMPSSEAVLNRLEWTVIRRLDGLLQGDYRTLFRGAGLDLSDLRSYQHHDDVRHIDWNVTARLDDPHVRQFSEDRDLTAWFILDLSGSVDFGTAPAGTVPPPDDWAYQGGGTRESVAWEHSVRTKRRVSAEFVAVLARVLTRHGNRVGAVFFGSDIDAVLPAKSGRGHVLHLLQRLRTHTASESSEEIRLERLLQRAGQLIPRRAMVFVVSDFISAPGWSKALANLAQRHEVLAVRLYDPVELDLPDIGLVTLQDAETGEQLFVDTHDAAFRRRFAAAAEAREAALHQAFVEAGVDTLELATTDDLLDAVLRFTDMRRQRSRQSAGVPAHLKIHTRTSS